MGAGIHIREPRRAWKPAPMQFGMLLEEARGKSQASRVEQLVIHFHEPVDALRLRSAWKRLVDRHETLRARFSLEGDLQRAVEFAEQVELPWDERDLRRLAPDARAAGYRAWLQDDRTRGFRMEAAPLFRMNLLRLGAQEFRFIFTFHHLLLDGRSLPLLLQELSALYDLPAGPLAPLPSPASYREFLAWHEEWESAHQQDLTSFWSAYLDGASDPAELRLPRPESRASPGSLPGSVAGSLEPAAASELRSLAEHLGVGTAALVHTAWALVLAQYTGETDLTFGILRHGRRGHLANADRALGVFANMLPLRIPLRRAGRLADLIQWVQRQSRELRPYEQTPLPVIGELARARGTSSHFESLVAFETYDPDVELKRAFSNRETRFVELLESAPAGLTAGVHLGDTLRLRLGYDAGRYCLRDVQHLATDFLSVLRRLPQSLEVPVDRFSVLAPENRARLLDWGTSRTRATRERLLHHWFEAQVDRDPTAIAVCDTGEAVTYGQLEHRANQVARALQAEGVTADELVGLHCHRSAAGLAALLGILKSGAAYLPLDPDLPSARLRHLAQTANLRLVVTQKELSHQLPSGDFRALRLEELERRQPNTPAERPSTVTGPRHLCYAIGTSGSTGAPKLVAIEHRSIDNLLEFATRQLLQPDDVRCVPFTDTLAADASVHQIFAVLGLGGSLVVISDPLELAHSSHFERFTYFGSTPSLLSALLAADGLPPQVRTIGLGAEPVPPSLLTALRARPHVRQVLNFYGPTETTIYCTVDRLFDRQAAADPPEAAPENAETRGRIIGRPIENTHVLVLSSKQQLVPEGVPGELYVAGLGVARGYQGQPELTAQRFVEGLCDGPAEARYYRTGDRVRWLPDGRLEFLGRLDQQVKIRGYRVEPAELEQALRRVAGVLEAAVVARPAARDELGLVAFVVLDPLARLDPADLKQHLRGLFPAPMVPQRIIPLPALPVTTSGKVDLAALSVPAEFDEEPPEASPEASPLEELVRRAWTDVLQTPPTGAHDDFFDSGGHSLAALRLASHLSDLAGIRLPVSRVFQARTVRRIAEALLETLLADDALATDVLAAPDPEA